MILVLEHPTQNTKLVITKRTDYSKYNATYYKTENEAIVSVDDFGKFETLMDLIIYLRDNKKVPQWFLSSLYINYNLYK